MASGKTCTCVCCSFLCAVCKIACFTCARRLCPRCFNPPPQERTELSILCLGLEGAGKTTALAVVAGETADDPEPTMGFAIKTVNIQQHLTLNFQELGGSEQIRMYWDMYYTGRHLIMYVVDSSCGEAELTESSGVLTRCLCAQSLSQLPLLIVCTKQDLPSARPLTKMKAELKVGAIARERSVYVTGCTSKQSQLMRDAITRAILQLVGEHNTQQYTNKTTPSRCK